MNQQIDNAIKFHLQNELDKAEEIYLEILNKNSLDFDANHLYACVLHSKKLFEKSRIYFELAINLNPTNSDVFNNFGNLFFELKDWANAKDCYLKSLKINPNNSSAHNNLGTVYKELSEFTDAMNAFNRAIQLDQGYADAHWNRSILNLLLGNYTDGWREFEWRWSSKAVASMAGKKNYSSAPYNGVQPLKNKTLLIYHEQGLGDSIQFIRFAIFAADICDSIILHVPSVLVGLFTGLRDNIKVLPFDVDPGITDYHCSMMSLPLVLNFHGNDFPYPNGYIFPRTNYLDKWDKLLLIDKTRYNVGIAWSGNPGHSNDAYRSIPPRFIEEMLSINPHVNFISLQKEHREIDLYLFSTFKNFRNVSDLLQDFEDTLAICNLVDHVISVDTSVIHLASASGVESTILLPMVPDWRWLLNVKFSPWYSSLRLLRCKSINNWDNVFFDINNFFKNK